MKYEEAVEKVKHLNLIQRLRKNSIIYGIKKGFQHKPAYKMYQRRIQEGKKEINLYLTIIKAHKQARKLYAEVKRLESENATLVKGTK